MNAVAGRYDVVIVGAGLSGLMAGRQLAHTGLSVIIIEREPVAGGRLATWRSGSDRADIGAQFFTVRTAEFGAIIEQWLAAGWVKEWSRGWSDGSLLVDRPDGYPRYIADGGFAGLADRLSTGLPIHYATELRVVITDRDRWCVTTADDKQFSTHSLILTMPVPQSLGILNAGGIELPDTTRQALTSIQYGSCLCGVFAVDVDIELPEPGALQRPGRPVAWVADNRRKGLASTEQILTVHADPIASAKWWAETDESVSAWMAAELELLLSRDATFRPVAIKRWPYAVPFSVYPERCLVLRTSAPLILAGDAFDGPRVEGAALSGMAAADALLEALSVRS